MNWTDITVEQYQAICDIEHEDSFDTMCEMIAICHKLPIDEVDSMHISRFNELAKSVEFAFKPPLAGKAIPYFQGKVYRYRFTGDLTKVPAAVARYVEAKHFSKDNMKEMQNLHMVLASMVTPQKKNWLGVWKDVKFDAKLHEQYANELKQMKIKEELGWSAFFLRVSLKLNHSLVNYLKKKMTWKVMWSKKM